MNTYPLRLGTLLMPVPADSPGAQHHSSVSIPSGIIPSVPNLVLPQAVNVHWF